LSTTRQQHPVERRARSTFNFGRVVLALASDGLLGSSGMRLWALQKRKELDWKRIAYEIGVGGGLSIISLWRVPKLRRRFFEPEPPPT
jgi:hypothetical protein